MFVFIRIIRPYFNCLYYKTTSERMPGLLHYIEKVTVPFHTIHLDHVGLFNRSYRKNTQILVVVDAFTKFCIFEPSFVLSRTLR